MSSIENYDPHIFTEEEAARARFESESEYGTDRPYPSGPVGSRVNLMHFRAEEAQRDELGWHGTTRADLARQCNVG